MMQKLGSVIHTSSLKLFAVGILCVASVLLAVMPLLTSPLNSSHPLAVSALAWHFSYRLNKGFDVHEQMGRSLNLQRILSQTALPDRTVIITTLNEAWAMPQGMADLFLETFRSGENTTRLLNHLLIVTLDQKSYEHCISIHPHCFELKTADGVDFSGEKLYKSRDYLYMVWRRINFLQQVLDEGYSFLFSDADIMWFRDPFPYISPNVDFQIACDHYFGHPKSLRNSANGGFMYARANRRTIDFFKYWYRAREVFPGKHDQEVFNKIKGDRALVELGLRIEFFDTKYISGFCEPSHDPEKVVTVHANCCAGLQNKLDDLRRILADWRKIRSMTSSRRRWESPSWSAPKACTGFR